MNHMDRQTSDNGVAALGRLRETLQHVRRLCPDLPVLAIPWMHIKHPLHQVHVSMMRAEELPASGAAWVRRAAMCVLYGCMLTLRVAKYRWGFRAERASAAGQRFDLVAKTWCFSSTPPRGADFYYGNLQQQLAARGLRMLLICGGSERLDWSSIVTRRLYAEGIWRLPEYCLVPLWAPLRLAGWQIATSRRLRRVKAEDPLVARAIRQAGLDCLSREAMRAGLYFWIGQALARQWHPRAVVTLYEGNEWEPCLWWGVKTVQPGCRTVGYQHTVFFPESLALLQPVVDQCERSVPDVVLGLGQESCALMRESHEPHGVRLLQFGGFRCLPGARASHPADPRKRMVLVTPEGLAAEVEALFGFALRCAKHLPGYRFLFRCHPSFSMTRACALVPGLREQPNVVFSERRDLDEDLARCSVLLYRGSSSVLYAIARGLLSVYVHVDGFFEVDPLFRLSQWRLRCASPAEFVVILQQHERATPEQLDAEWRPAADYVAAYTQPVEGSAIEEFVRAAGLNGTAPS